MALTTSVIGKNVAPEVGLGAHRTVLVKVTFDSSQASGGEDFDPASFGIQDPTKALVFTSPRHTSDLPIDPTVTYDRTNKKLLVFGKTDASAYAEMSGCDLSCLVVDVLVIERD